MKDKCLLLAMKFKKPLKFLLNNNELRGLFLFVSNLCVACLEELHSCSKICLSMNKKSAECHKKIPLRYYLHLNLSGLTGAIKRIIIFPKKKDKKSLQVFSFMFAFFIKLRAFYQQRQQ
jgi:hypothetical protein